MKEIIFKYMKEHGFGEFNPKAVLFDMDGVLYNSMPNHAVAWQESMKQFDIHMTAADAYATEGARGIDTIQMMVKKQKGIDITLDEAQKMYDVKTEIFHSMPTAEIFPGVKEIMQKIKDAGMQVGVVTGSGQRPLIMRLLSPSREATFFSSFALSSKSVFPERIAIYSEKFMPDFSSIAPSSMVLAPKAPLFNCEIKVCLQCRRLNLYESSDFSTA